MLVFVLLAFYYNSVVVLNIIKPICFRLKMLDILYVKQLIVVLTTTIKTTMLCIRLFDSLYVEQTVVVLYILLKQI